MQKILIKNIGTIVSGDINNGIIHNADSIAVYDGLIQKIGYSTDFNESEFQYIVDANGQTAVPGFIDTHVHNGMEDYSACTGMLALYEDALRNGTTTMISEGEQGPGYPRFYDDTEGVKAECIFANHVYSHFKPGGGLKLHAGPLILTSELCEADFEELARKGIWGVAEIGAGGIDDLDKIAEMLKWARKYNYFVSVSLAPPSIPGSSWIHAEDVVKMNPDKVSHINGGSTSSSWEEIQYVIDNTTAAIELVPAGNVAKFNRVLQYMKETDQLDRIVFGSDSPTGASCLVGAINKCIVRAAALNDIPAEQVIAMATGNAAKFYNLSVGFIEEGKTADIVIIDAPVGCEGGDALGCIQMGDLFGSSLVIADGKIVATRGRDTRTTQRSCLINGTDTSPSTVYECIYSPPTYNHLL